MNGLKMPWYSLSSFLFFVKSKTVRKENCMRTTSIIVTAVQLCYFFEIAILEVSWSQLCSRFVINSGEAIGNNISKAKLQSKTLQTWIKIMLTNSFNKTWVNIMKRKTKGVPGKLSVSKNFDFVFQRTLHQNRCPFNCIQICCFPS